MQIDVTLAAQNAATPEFSIADFRGYRAGLDSVRCPVQAVRTTNTNAVVNIALDACMKLDAGGLLQRDNAGTLEDAWNELAADFLAFAAGDHDEVSYDFNLVSGFLYRLRYDSNQVAPIRIVVATSARGRG